MSLLLDAGMPSERAFPTTVKVKIDPSHALMKLMMVLDWTAMIKLILPDLQKTAGIFWFLGRKLHVRIHLSIFILQSLLKMTDRKIEESVRLTPLYQVFCGLSFLKYFYVPDHTKIEEFRNRLSPETQQKLAIMIIQLAAHLGFTSFQTIDIDSTVQEAGISYPADSVLLKKLANKANAVLSFFNSKVIGFMAGIQMQISEIATKARSYFFRAKNMAVEKSREYFNTYYETVKTQVMPIINALENLSIEDFQKLPWNIRNQVHFLLMEARKYLEDVAYFIKNHTIKQGKLLSFHLREVACITKGKLGKKCEFGRVFQLGRLLNNFIIPFTCTSIQMNDKTSLIPIIAGIEALIGHVKSFGLRKSTMKSDRGVLASGYRSVLAFNLHQLSRKLSA